MTGTVWTDHGDEPLPARVRSWEVEAHYDAEADEFCADTCPGRDGDCIVPGCPTFSDGDATEGVTDLRDALLGVIRGWQFDFTEAAEFADELLAVLAVRPVAAQERIDAALALHVRQTKRPGTAGHGRCVREGEVWPCSTRRALTGDASPTPPSYPECHETVTDDDGIEGPCNYHAVRDRLDSEEDSPYPVCAVHDRPPYPASPTEPTPPMPCGCASGKVVHQCAQWPDSIEAKS